MERSLFHSPLFSYPNRSKESIYFGVSQIYGPSPNKISEHCVTWTHLCRFIDQSYPLPCFSTHNKRRWVSTIIIKIIAKQISDLLWEKQHPADSNLRNKNRDCSLALCGVHLLLSCYPFKPFQISIDPN